MQVKKQNNGNKNDYALVRILNSDQNIKYILTYVCV